MVADSGEQAAESLFGFDLPNVTMNGGVRLRSSSPGIIVGTGGAAWAALQVVRQRAKSAPSVARAGCAEVRVARAVGK
jgi:hypothetical protein